MAAILLFSVTFVTYRTHLQNRYRYGLSEKPYISDCDHEKYATAPIKPSNRLNDLNDIHLLHAQTNGLKRILTSNEEFYREKDSLLKSSVLVEVVSNRFYQIKVLKHSLPYLIPEAVDMLNEIGYLVELRLSEKRKKPVRMMITSMLRTEDEQSKLEHHNHNATEHSAHLYGTTVDISYKDFYNPENGTILSSYDGVQVLTKVLIEMRKECKLLVVRERKQACFHVTVVVCKSESIKKT